MLAGLTAALAPNAAAAPATLRWMQPAGSPPVTEFRIYKGPGIQSGALVYEGLPVLVGRVYTIRVEIPEIDAGTPVYVWVTAVNPAGESRPSRAEFFGPPRERIGAPGTPRFDLE